MITFNICYPSVLNVVLDHPPLNLFGGDITASFCPPICDWHFQLAHGMNRYASRDTFFCIFLNKLSFGLNLTLDCVTLLLYVNKPADFDCCESDMDPDINHTNNT